MSVPMAACGAQCSPFWNVAGPYRSSMENGHSYDFLACRSQPRLFSPFLTLLCMCVYCANFGEKCVRTVPAISQHTYLAWYEIRLELGCLLVLCQLLLPFQICLNGWIWSTIFHTRDYPLTELLDYAFAYSIVLVTLYCMVMRMLHRYSLFLRGVLTLAFISYYINYFAYLSVGKLQYSFNMKVNIATGALTAVGWFVWCRRVRYRRPYFKRILRFYVLLAMAMSLELLDFPPILWILDAHSLWHLATVPILSLYYEWVYNNSKNKSYIYYPFNFSFMIEDCQTLRKEKLLTETYPYFDKEMQVENVYL